jgi:hypothetical protein
MARTLLRMCSSTLILSCVSCDEGGVVAFDDSSNRHVAKVLRFLRPSLHGRLEELDLSGYRTYGADGLMYRMARRLGKVQLTAFRRIAGIAREWNAPFHAF